MKRLLLAAVAWAAAPLAGHVPLAPDPDIQIGTLSTGVTYYIWPSTDESEPVSMRLVVPVGSVVEQEGEEGIAHFVEHLTFRGSDRYSETDIRDFIEAAGGGIGADANATTSFDSTVYMLDLPAGDPQLIKTGLAIFADFAERARLDDASIEAERGIVLEEWRLGLGFQTRILNRYLAALFDGSPYADRLPIGLERTLRSVSPKTLRTFYDRWYRRVPLAVVVTGPCDPQVAEEAIRTTFEAPHFPQRPRTRPEITAPTVHTQQLQLACDPEMPHSAVEVNYKREPRPLKTEEDIRERLISFCYYTLMYQRFMRLNEQGLFPSETLAIGSDNPLTCLKTESFDCLCLAEDTRAVLQTLLSEIQTAALFGFTPEEHQMVSSEVQAMIRSSQCNPHPFSSPRRALTCINHFLSGSIPCSDKALVKAYAHIIPTITLNDLNAFATRFRDPWDAFIHIACPESLELVQADIEALIEAAKQTPYSPYTNTCPALPEIDPLPGTFATEERYLLPNLITLRTEGGMTLHLMTTDDPTTISCEAFAVGGLTSLNLAELSSGRIATPLLSNSGIAGLLPSEVASALAGSSLGLSRGLTSHRRLISATAHPDDIETLFQLLHLVFTAQVNSPAVFHQIIDRLLIWENTPDTPLEALDQTLIEILHPDSPYFAATDWTVATFESADRIAKMAFSNPADFTICFAGPLDLATMRALAEKYLASIPGTDSFTTTFTPLNEPFPTGITTADIHKGKEAQCTTKLCFPLSLPDTSSDTSTLCSDALSIIERRTERILRQALSATYTVDLEANLLHPNLQEGQLVLTFTSDPEDAFLLSQVALRELRKLKESGPTDAEVTTCALQQKRTLSKQMENSCFWASELADCVLYNRDLNELATIENRPDVLTKENLHQMIRTLLPLDNYVLLTLYPEE